jgi:[acyl-carrier-protein] S-malonyltransferase
MLDYQTTAFVFPGQGSQFVGMGRELAQASPAARQTFEEADEYLGFNLSQLCWEGPEAELTDTVNAQPALVTCSVASLRALHEKYGEHPPALAAGHSLGEISALVAAGSLEFEDGVLLVRRRGEVMKAAGQRAPGGMAAILGLDAPVLAEVCAEASAATGGSVQVANDNCPGQVVISGDEAALEKAMEMAKARGAKRARRLPVSIAAHSPLMRSAVDDYRRTVDGMPFIAPIPPVVGNVQALPLLDPNDMRVELPAQLTSPVQWTASVRYMLGQGVTTFVELGAKDVLTALLKRIEPTARGLAVGTPESLEAFGAL